MNTLDWGTLEANTSTTKAAQKASFWMVDKKSISKPKKWLTVEQATTTSELLGGRTEDWGQEWASP